ncbi:integrase core domain-containing protein, partial [Nocardia cyriacigeorgica]
VDKWMRWYNTRRRHSSIGMIAPISFEQSLSAAATAA